jgi:methyl-accepting chemotaxis protein
MFHKKKSCSTSSSESDMKLLLECMERAISGDFSAIDPSSFQNPEIAEKYNAVLETTFKVNNQFVMRLNDSMTRIGDSSIVKDMIEQVTSMSSAMKDMHASDKELSDSIVNVQYAVQSIQDNSHSIMNISKLCSQ